MEQVIYECKDNGNRIKFVLDDGIVEEIHVQTHDSESWIVISMNDLLSGLSKSSQLPLINHLWLAAKTNCTEKCTCHAECYHADKIIGQFRTADEISNHVCCDNPDERWNKHSGIDVGTDSGHYRDLTFSYCNNCGKVWNVEFE